METVLQDLRFSIRQLRRAPGFTIIAVLTLALGIGANTAIFSVLEGVLLAPLPYADPNRLVLLLLYNRTLKYPTDLSYSDFLDWQRQSRSFERIGAFKIEGVDLTSPGAPQHLPRKRISSGFFRTLGIKMALGSDLSPSQDQHGAAPEVIISHRLWADLFASSSAAIGRPVILDGTSFTLAGVLPASFRFDNENADVYTPLAAGDTVILSNRTVHDIACVARLKPGVTLRAAQAELNAVQQDIDRLNPATELGLSTYIGPLKPMLIGDVSQTLFLLLGGVGLVLLIACANVANLLLARSAARGREFAVRLALGARRAHIVRQLLTESVLLSVLGGAAGLALAQATLHAFTHSAPISLFRSDNIAINAPVLFFALGISLSVGVLFGLAPAWKSSKTGVDAALKEGSRGSTGIHHRAQNVLVIAQIALTLVLLMSAGLLFRTIHNLWQVNPGFNAQHVLTFKVGLAPGLTQTAAGVRSAYTQLVDRIRHIPGVSAADITALLPLSQLDNSGGFWVGDERPASVAQAPRAVFFWTGPEYLRTMQIPLVRGRFLTAADTIKSEPVVVIDTVLARNYFPHSDPIGQTITIPQWGRVRIVGLVNHVQARKLGGPDQYSQNQIYASFYQLADRWVPAFRSDITLVVRTPLPLAATLPAIKAVVYGADRSQPIYAVRSMPDVVGQSMSSQRLPMILLGVFALLALLLAAVGTYGVVSYSVSQRAHELGIRMALGARKGDLFQMVIGLGLRLAFVGVALGAVATALLTRSLASFSHLLYGVETGDPVTLLTVSLTLLIVALLACYFPAQRATRADPAVTLRSS